MKTSDFDYHLPESSIAQTPLEPRDSSRLLVLHRKTGILEHRIFNEIGEYLNPGDLLVLNQTRVIPARLYARKPTGGKVELLLLRKRNDLTWECLVGGKGLRVGNILGVESDDSSRRIQWHDNPKSGDFGLRAEIIEILNGSERLVKFSEPVEPYFPKVGHVPLPPYIHERLDDPERYQTVYAREPGSVAAPTAGLHFTPDVLARLTRRGVAVHYLTLHVGPGTFRPLRTTRIDEHRMEAEPIEIPEPTARAVQEAKRDHRRVVAVGTTTTRALEWAAGEDGRLRAGAGEADLFIQPGHRFHVVDALVTNFHLPRSTLLVLVAAFAGRELVLDAYRHAVAARYRFYSYGDAMLIQ
jgi:S-adenosylmethionine:tRNA ribosyltransferase-isomerase